MTEESIHPLRRWREAKGKTRAECAEGTGVSVVAWGRYEKGRRVPGPDVMQRIFAFTEGEIAPNDFYNIAIKEDEPDAPRRPVAA